MAVNSPGWGVRLEGDTIDVGDLQEMLPAPFDPWVEVYADAGGRGLVLRSRAWASLTEARHVHVDADRILERLHGEALLVDSDAKRVTPGQVFNFRAGGLRDTISIVHSATMHMAGGRVRIRVSAATGGQPPPPSETKIQQWFAQAEVEDLRSDLFSHITRANNWYDLYKVMEITRRILGNSGHLKRALGADSAEWELVWRTANCYRHAPDPIKYPLPVPPAELPASRLFVLKIVSRLI